LLGVRAVLAESFERIHRSNLVGMGVLPLQFPAGETAGTLGLTGHETFTVTGLAGADPGRFPRTVTVDADGMRFDAILRLGTHREQEYVRHGGIMRYTVRRLLDR
jgi:aconitate hydratase